MKKILAIFILAILLLAMRCGVHYYVENREFVKTDYENMDLDGYDKLMIVAHPDDDMLWGGSKLIKDDYVVVCITCGVNKTRVEEFESVMKETNDKYVMLGYPDKTNHKRDDWSTCKGDIYDDIEAIYNLKDWKEIVTHNPEGEYGHIHHKMTSEIVTNTVSKDKLVYFGKYYSKKKYALLEEVPPMLDEDTIEKKKDILDLYTSQASVIESFSHMIPHEDYKTYDEWQELYNEENR